MVLGRAGVSSRALIGALIAPIVWALLAAVGTRAASSLIGEPFLACVVGGTVGLTIAAIPWTGAIARRAPSILRRGLVRGTAQDPVETVV